MVEEKIRVKLLQESLNREPPEPEVVADLPSDDDFYDGEIPEWTSDDQDG